VLVQRTSPERDDGAALAHLIAERAHVASSRGDTLIVGLCGAQGSGKSTLATVMQSHVSDAGFNVAKLSLDDVYLPLAAREQLARTVHPLFKTRGVPGTHDIPLARRVLSELKSNGVVPLPQFDKATDDRRPSDAWPRVQAPVDVVIFEGWCVGAVAEPEAALREPLNELERIEDAEGTWRRYANTALGREYQELFAELDLLVLLAAPGFDVVYRWRLEQENELRRQVAQRDHAASRLMTNAQLERFVSHYERLTRHILNEMPARAHVVVRLDAERRKTIEKVVA
jgi:D-glycerate 3-kinase